MPTRLLQVRRVRRNSRRRFGLPLYYAERGDFVNAASLSPRPRVARSAPHVNAWTATALIKRGTLLGAFTYELQREPQLDHGVATIPGDFSGVSILLANLESQARSLRHHPGLFATPVNSRLRSAAVLFVQDSRPKGIPQFTLNRIVVTRRQSVAWSRPLRTLRRRKKPPAENVSFGREAQRL